MKRTAEELAESFVNGNRSDVFKHLDELKGGHAALLTIWILDQLSANERASFKSMLINQARSGEVW